MEAKLLLLGIGALISGFIWLSNRYPVAMEKRRLAKFIKETASSEHHDFLIANVLLKNSPYRFMDVLALLALIGFVIIPLTPVEGTTVGEQLSYYFAIEPQGWGTPIMVVLIFAQMLQLFGVLASCFMIWEAAFKTYGSNQPDELALHHFLTEEQFDLLFVWVDSSKEDRYLEALFIEEVLMPDLLVDVLKRKEEMDAYIELHEEIEDLEDGTSAHLTKEQKNRIEEGKAKLQESLQTFQPNFEQVFNAISEDYYDMSEEAKRDSLSIQEVFNEKQSKIEEKMMNLNRNVAFSQQHRQQPAPLPEAVLELRRVAESTSVSSHLKETAIRMAVDIQAKLEAEKNMEKKKMEDMDAIAVIKASELFYGMTVRGETEGQKWN